VSCVCVEMPGPCRDESDGDDFLVQSDLNPHLYIYKDVNNSNLIMCGCGFGYGVRDIRWIWIIR
jgi:acetone carboxylase gamma subunit